MKLGASGGVALGVCGSIGLNVEIDVGEMVDVAEGVGNFFDKIF